MKIKSKSSLFKLSFSLPIILFFLLIGLQTNFAQSTNPDTPTNLTSGIIEGTNSGGRTDVKTLYYAFNVVKGNLKITLDVTPNDKNDGGGVVQWTLMNTKFATLKYDNLAATRVAERQVKDLPVTLKRRIIMKITVDGNVSYKFKLEGSAVNFR